MEPGTAVRISTGAPIPDGADAVVPQELTSVEDSTVSVDKPIRRNYHVRPAGEDITAGELVVHAGSLLGPAELGVLASLNIPRPASCAARAWRSSAPGTSSQIRAGR